MSFRLHRFITIGR